MSIKRMMSTKLISVPPATSLSRMVEILEKLPIHHILVMEDTQLVGIVSDRDVHKHLSPFVGTASETPQDLLTTQRQAKDIMTPKPVTIGVSSGIRDAARVLLDHQVSLLPVTDDDNLVIGVLSWKDVLRFLVD